MNIDLSGLEFLDPKQELLIKETIYKVLNASDLKDYYLSVGLIDAGEMRKLCKRYKKKDKVTDVLSFPLPKMEQGFAHTQKILGDIVICVEQAKLQADECGHSLAEEMAVLCAHGLFHLLGYDHEISDEEANMQLQGEMYLLEKADISPEIALLGRA